MISVFAGSKIDANRNSLHHFDVIASGVLGRDEAETLSRSRIETTDIAAVGSSAGVNINVDWLTGAHTPKLCLSKVGGDPDIIKRNHRKQRLSRLNPIARLNILITDRPRNRSCDFRVAEIEQFLI
jgi:hypothetical protein